MLPVVAKNSRAGQFNPSMERSTWITKTLGPTMSLRQQIMAYETDLLEFSDIFEGSKV